MTAPSPPKKNRLKEQRERSRLSIQEVATLIGVTPSAVSRHESATRSLDDETVKKYAALYKCETHELFFDLDDSVTVKS